MQRMAQIGFAPEVLPDDFERWARGMAQQTMLDLDTQIHPLDMPALRPDGTPSAIPVEFKEFLALVGPKKKIFGLWPYQIKIFEALFTAWEIRSTIDPADPNAKLPDVDIKQARQSGKTVPTGLFLAFMIIVYRLQVVLTSTKTQKTRKIARYILSIMRMAGEQMMADGVGEARFDDEAGFVCLSGKKEAERESDTAHIVFIDESQDIDYEPVYGDLSPMRAGTTGILVTAGIGGVPESLGERLRDDPNSIKVIVTADEVIAERPHYRLTAEADKAKMLPWEWRAHYMCERITNNSALLIENIYDWDEAFPGYEFNPDWKENPAAADWQLEVGLDFGRKFDSSVGIGVAYLPKEDIYVLYGFTAATSVGWTVQVAQFAEWLETVPWDRVRPESNSMGDVVEEVLYKELEERELINPESYVPIQTTDETKAAALRTIAIHAMRRKFYFVRNKQWDPDGLCDRVITELKQITVKTNIRNKMEISHSDAGSALLTLFHLVPKGYVYEPRHHRAA